MMSIDDFLMQWNDANPRLLVHTSGSTGEPKPLWVEKQRMRASARLTCRFLQLQPGDTALLCLPLDFIAGKMMVVRALESGLRLLDIPPDSHPLKVLKQRYSMAMAVDFAAMIPMQVVRSLETPEEAEALKAIRRLIIGGGAVDEALARQLRTFPHAVYSTYGMTETLSHVALRRLSGPDASPWYTPFEGVQLSLDADSRIVIDAPAVCGERLLTNDLGEMHPDGRHFRVLGRIDNVICTGGIKVQAEEVERLLGDLVGAPYFITASPDAVYGQVVTIVVETPSSDDPDLWLLRQQDHFKDVLPPYWVPRKAVFVAHLPMTPTGKVKRMLPQNSTFP